LNSSDSLSNDSMSSSSSDSSSISSLMETVPGIKFLAFSGMISAFCLGGCGFDEIRPDGFS
jgi:hypothetical protein